MLEQPNPTPPIAALAGQIRALRTARGLTLGALAEAAGLDKGFLSRLERGQKSPSIATLLRLSAALSVPVSELLGERLDDAQIHVTRAGTRRRAPRTAGEPGYDFESLTRGTGADALEAFLTYPPPDFTEGGQRGHGGEELLFVLSGVIEVAFSDRHVTLATGDSVQFPGHVPHRMRSVGGAAVGLVAVARPR